jgi:DNA-binding NarL/FixJ family response regulator
MDNKIRLFVVEDDPVCLKQIFNIINQEADMLVVNSAQSVEQAILFGKALDYDMILIDLHLSVTNHDGIEVLTELRKVKDIPAIILTWIDDPDSILEAFNKGAVFYVLKKFINILPQTIRSIYYNPFPMNILLEQYHDNRYKLKISELTSTEKEVFELLQKGFSATQIANIRDKSIDTIQSQVKSILNKLDLKSRKEIKNVNNL